MVKSPEVEYLLTCETQVFLFVIATESVDGRMAIDLYIMTLQLAMVMMLIGNFIKRS